MAFEIIKLTYFTYLPASASMVIPDSTECSNSNGKNND